MPYQSILVHLDDHESCAERVRVAAGLAARFEAHLIGLYASDPYPAPVAYRSPLIGQRLESMQREALTELRDTAAAIFASVQSPGLSTEWRTIDRDARQFYPYDLVASHARYADLIVVGQSERDDGLWRVPAQFPETFWFGVGRPAIVVPSAGRFEQIGERVLIAWNASREAARAVADALPILQRAGEVTLLAINSERGRDGAIDCADAAWYLARHGVKATADSRPAKDAEVGDLLLSRASEMHADLLVMGAYGHSRLSEFVLGGATRTVLRKMTLPVLFAN